MSLDGSTTGGALPQASASSLGVLPGVATNGAPMLAQQKTPRGDRLEVRLQEYRLGLLCNSLDVYIIVLQGQRFESGERRSVVLGPASEHRLARLGVVAVPRPLPSGQCRLHVLRPTAASQAPRFSMKSPAVRLPAPHERADERRAMLIGPLLHVLALLSLAVPSLLSAHWRSLPMGTCSSSPV